MESGAYPVVLGGTVVLVGFGSISLRCWPCCGTGVGMTGALLRGGVVVQFLTVYHKHRCVLTMCPQDPCGLQ